MTNDQNESDLEPTTNASAFNCGSADLGENNHGPAILDPQN